MSPTALKRSTALGSQSATALARAVDQADVGYDLVLGIGQSNMVGRGTPLDTTNLDVTDSRVWVFATTGSLANQIVRAIDPLNHHDGVAQGVGPLMPFARWYAGSVPSNRKVLLIPAGHGATNFTLTPGSWSWNVNALAADNLYLLAIAQVKAALAAAGANARLACILWHQGEGSGGDATYAASLDAMIAGLRSNLADVPFVLGQMSPDYISGPGGAPAAAINLVHIDTPQRVLRTGFAYTPAGTVGDNTHLNATAQRALGRNMYDALVLARGNVLGPPLAPSSVTATQSATSLNVSWGRPAAHVTDYTVQYRLVGAGSWTTLSRATSIDNTAVITGITMGAAYDVQVASVNAQGTSAFTATTITTVNVPGQVTGLTAGTATTSSQPLTWTARPGGENVTGYLVEYKATSSGTWLTSQTVASTSATVTGLLASTSYDYRVSAINAGGTGAVSATTTASTASLALLLTDVPVTAAAAYGLRLLRSGYAGSAIRVRRSSDSTEQDIGFAGGILDTAALLTFAGSGSAFVKVMYDQSGSGFDMTQATTTKQPRIVNAGVLDTLNGLPTMIFDGVDDYFERSGTIGLWASASGSTALAVIKSSGALLPVFAEALTGTDAPFYEPFMCSSSGIGVTSRIRNDANTFIVNSASNAVNLSGALRQVDVIDSLTAINVRVDGTASATVNYTRTGTLTLNNFSVGADHRASVGTGLAMSLSELVLFASPLSTANRDSGRTNQKGYFATA